MVDVFGTDAVDQFTAGKLDAYMAFPPDVQVLRKREVGQVILRTAVDAPWSQYFCCMMAANREYATRYPVATKRVIRAVLKAADLCAREPEAAARLIVEGGATGRYDYALQTLTENPYGVWREYDAEDTMRFYALRLHELGLVKSSPQKIIANGTDWRFIDELKRELKT
jgi:NitT/TauT family transport system substrate-binding protein